MVHGVVPPFYDTVTTKTARSIGEHNHCLGILKLHFDFPESNAIPVRVRCIKCKREDFPRTLEEMKRKIENVRQSVKYE